MCGLISTLVSRQHLACFTIENLKVHVIYSTFHSQFMIAIPRDKRIFHNFSYFEFLLDPACIIFYSYSLLTMLGDCFRLSSFIENDLTPSFVIGRIASSILKPSYTRRRHCHQHLVCSFSDHLCKHQSYSYTGRRRYCYRHLTI
jgi:hypothetical protein